jgi:hypothetical protein
MFYLYVNLLNVRFFKAMLVYQRVRPPVSEFLLLQASFWRGRCASGWSLKLACQGGAALGGFGPFNENVSFSGDNMILVYIYIHYIYIHYTYIHYIYIYIIYIHYIYTLYIYTLYIYIIYIHYIYTLYIYYIYTCTLYIYAIYILYIHAHYIYMQYIYIYTPYIYTRNYIYIWLFNVYRCLFGGFNFVDAYRGFSWCGCWGDLNDWSWGSLLYKRCQAWIGAHEKNMPGTLPDVKSPIWGGPSHFKSGYPMQEWIITMFAPHL